MAILSNKRLVLGVTGGIAAYKSADLVRKLKQQGAEVRVVMTAAAKEFITPLTMQAVSGHPIHDDLLDPDAEAAMGHIELARWADAIIIAPASADFLAQIAHGHARDLLATLCLATAAPIAVAPAMNQQMWHDISTQENLALIAKHQIHIFGPASGEQACSDVGLGRMLEPQELVKEIQGLFQQDILTGVNVVVTAGPTQEAIDPARYLTNHSSGKMGYAIAQAAQEAGANVTLISGPTHLTAPERVNLIKVISALDMHKVVLAEIKTARIFIACAAVADYRVAQPKQKKLKKQEDNLQLALLKNPDILADVAQLKQAPLTVGFAAETDNVIKHAKEKLQQKQIDMIIANQVGLQQGGFNDDENTVTLLSKNKQQTFALMHKQALAKLLIKEIAKHYHEKYSA